MTTQTMPGNFVMSDRPQTAQYKLQQLENEVRHYINDENLYVVRRVLMDLIEIIKEIENDRAN